MARPRNPAPALKETLARVAREIIVAEGPDALTVRAAAAAAGVSANAPYFHYRGGAAELLAAAAIGGFADLCKALRRPPLPAAGIDAVRELVLRYVGFGVRHPNLYRAMFHHRIAEPLEAGTTEEKGEATFAELRQLKLQAYEDVVAPLALLRDEGALRGAQDSRGAPGLALAALAHGLVGEFIDEGLVRPEDPARPWTKARRAMTAEITDVMLMGLLGDVAAARATSGPTRAPMRPGDDPGWRHYRETILEFFPGEHAITVDLRRPVRAAALAQLRDRGLPHRFAVLTAWNPRGRASSADANAERDRSLKEVLRADGQMWVRVDGTSPDGTHREKGVAVALSKEEARELAIGYGQSAIYWCDNGTFSIVGALVEAEEVELPGSDAMRMRKP